MSYPDCFLYDLLFCRYRITTLMISAALGPETSTRAGRDDDQNGDDRIARANQL